MQCIAETINAKKYGDPIDIDWTDSLSDGDAWHIFNSAMKVSDEVICKTRAFFVGETAEHVHIVHTLGKTKENEMTGLLLIHKGTITKVE